MEGFPQDGPPAATTGAAVASAPSTGTEGCPDLAALRRELEAAGFRLCGAFHPLPEDAVPPLPDGSPAGTLLLVGNAGSALWRKIREAPEAAGLHPFDRYTRRIVGDLAARFGAEALYPSDGPPWHPFQRWARRAEPGLEASPLGMLIHPVHGLWHAYRAALVFAAHFDLSAPPRLGHPCAECRERPCLSACPARALGPKGYDVPACRAFLAARPASDCMRLGCLARHACPVGRECAYEPDHAAHHMRAFAAPPQEQGRSRKVRSSSR